MKSKVNLSFCMLLVLFNFYNTKIDAQLTHPCGDVNCTANDFVLNSAFLASDLNGTPLNSSACDNGTTDAYVCVRIKNKTNSSRNGLYVKTRITENENEVLLSNCFDQNMPGNTEVTLCMPMSYQWSCSSELTLTDYLVSWSVGNHDICPGGTINCGATNKAKCVNISDQNIKVDIPVIAKFGYSCEANGDFNDLIFQNQSLGGDNSAYTYSWTFSSGVQNNSTLENPTNRYTSSISTTNTILTVTDANGATDEVSVDISITSCLQLPVELVSFDVRKIHKQISLIWITANEFNNLGFEIQRSIDSRHWENIHFVPAKSSTQNINEYSFTDNNAPKSKIYYRLKQLDHDGKFEYSHIISYKNTSNNIAHLYPNPNKGNFQISEGSEGKLIVFNNCGKAILYMDYDGKQDIDISHLPAGSYNLKLICPFETYHMKLIKE